MSGLSPRTSPAALWEELARLRERVAGADTNIANVAAGKLSLSGGAIVGPSMTADVNTLALDADTSFKLYTPGIHAGSIETGYILRLTDDSNGEAEYVPLQVANVAALKTLPAGSVPDGWIVRTLGYYTDGDGGEGVYRYWAASTATANDGTVIDPTNLSGRFILIVEHNTISAKQFGVKGDGTTDDTTQMQAAVDAAAAASYNLVVHPGTYLCSALLPRTNTRVIGAGFATIFKLKAASTNGIFRAVPGTPVDNVLLRGFKIDGNKANASSSADHCRMGGNYITIEDVFIENCAQCGVNIGYDLSTNVTLRNVRVLNPATASNNYGGIAFTRVNNGEIIGCVVESTESYMAYAIDLESNSGYAGADNGNITISDCKCLGGPINLAFGSSAAAGRPSRFTIANCIVNMANSKSSTTSNTAPLAIINADDVTVIGCTFYDHPTGGVGSTRGAYLDGASNLKLIGNTFNVTWISGITANVIGFTTNPSSGYATGNRFIGIGTSPNQPRFIRSNHELLGRDFVFKGNHATNFLQGADSEAMSGRINTVVANTTAETTLLCPSHAVTVTIATPAVFTATAHGMSADTPVQFTTTGALPTGLTAWQTYYVIAAGRTANDFKITSSLNGTTFTVTVASPGVFTSVAHGLAAGDEITFRTTGALPTGLAGTAYYVIATGLTADTFQVSTTPGGSAVNTSGSQSGTHNWRKTVATSGSQSGTHAFMSGVGAQGSYTGTRIVPANTVTVGKAYRITASGMASTGLGSSITIRVRLGAALLLAKTFTPIASQSNKGWLLDAVVSGVSAGASGAVSANGTFLTDLFSGVNFLRGDGGTTTNQTQENMWNVTWQWGAGVSASDTTTLNSLVIIPIN